MAIVLSDEVYVALSWQHFGRCAGRCTAPYWGEWEELGAMGNKKGRPEI